MVILEEDFNLVNLQRKDNKMKILIVSTIAVVAGLNVLAQTQKVTVTVESETPPTPATAQEKRTVALVVQNHTAQGAVIPFMALTDALTAKLSGRGFQVVNPYNEIGVNLNRTAVGEKMPEVSAMEIARRLKADGAVTASVLEFLDSTIGSPPILHQYSIRISLNLADAQTGAAVCGETIKVKSPKYTNNQVNANRQEYLGDLLYAAAEECAVRLEKNPAVNSWNPTPPPPPPKKPMPLPLGTSLDHKVDLLVREMLVNSQFVKNYEESKERQGGHLPVAVIGGIENKSGNVGLNSLIEAAGERFRVKLFNSKLFEVKDDGVLVALAKRIVASENSPLEDGEIMSVLKQHGSPDFFVAGDLKHLTDLDGMGYYKLRIAIHSLLTGKIVWEGIETFNLKKEVSK